MEPAPGEPLSFPERLHYTHRVHRFPGKFHPPLVAHILSQHGDAEAVADPMCGSGTVGVEAVLAQRTVLLADLDPLSCLVTRAKCNPVEEGLLWEAGNYIMEAAGKLPKVGEGSPRTAKGRVTRILEGTKFRAPFNLTHWFDPYVAVGFARVMRAAWEFMGSQRDAHLRDALYTTLAATVRRISRADPQPVSGLEVTKIRRRQLKQGLTFDVAREFRKALNALAVGYGEMPPEHLGEAKVVQADVRRFADVCRRQAFRPSLCITSPPYCNAIEYWRRHRLEYQWLGLVIASSMANFTRRFVGSTTVRHRDLARLEPPDHDDIRRLTDQVERNGFPRKANLLRRYFIDTGIWLGQLAEALAPDGTMYLVVGASTSHGVVFDTPSLLTDLAEGSGFRLEESSQYRVINNKMQYPTHNGAGIRSETVLRFCLA